MARTKLAARKKGSRKKQTTKENSTAVPSALPRSNATAERQNPNSNVVSLPAHSQNLYMGPYLVIPNHIGQDVKTDKCIIQSVIRENTSSKSSQTGQILELSSKSSWRPLDLVSAHSFRSKIRSCLQVEYPDSTDPSFLALQVDVLRSKVEWMQTKLQVEINALQNIENPAEAWVQCIAIDNLRDKCKESDKFRKEMEQRLSGISQQEHGHDLPSPARSSPETGDIGLLGTISNVSEHLQSQVQQLQLDEDVPEVMTRILEIKKCIASLAAIYNDLECETMPPWISSRTVLAEAAVELAMQRVDARAEEQDAVAQQLNNEIQQSLYRI